MFSLRSILFAAAAFASIASAIPAPPMPNIPAPIPNIPGATDLLGGALSGGALSNGAVPPVKRGTLSFGDRIGDCHDKIEVIVVEIGKAVHCEGGPTKVDHKIVLGLLEEIVVLLKDLLIELKVFVKIDLLLNGVVCTLKDLAGVIAGLVILVLEVVYLVLSIVGFLDVTLCGVIATIGVTLCDILKLVIFLLVDIKVELALILKGYAGHCGYVHWGGILTILDIVLKL